MGRSEPIKTGEFAEPLVPPIGWEELRPWVKLRHELGLTQGQISGAANCAPTVISELERGCRRITPRWIERYSDAVSRYQMALDGEDVSSAPLGNEPRPGGRGPAPDHDTDRRCLEIRDCLQAWGFSAGYAQIAAVLSVERGDRVSADSVRARFRARLGR